MTQYIPQGAARGAIWDAPDHSADPYYVPSSDILSMNATRRANQPADTGTITIDNGYGQYSTRTEDVPGIDDKLVVMVGSDADARGHGEGPMGAGPMGGYRRAGTYLVTDRSIDSTGGGTDDPESTITLDVTDYVYGILSQRRPFAYNESSKPIAGTEDAHLNQLLRDFAPQISRDGLVSVDLVVDYAVHAKYLKDAVAELAGIVADEYDGAITYGQFDQLILRPLGSGPNAITPRYTDPLTASDFQGDFNSGTESHEMVNFLRIDGGIDTDNLADSQEVVDHFVSVSSSNRLQTRLDTPKPELPRFHIYTRGDGTSDDGIRVRLQRDDGAGTGPIAPGDTDYDLGRSRLRKVALSLDDWTTFRLGEHDAFEREPWLIIDSPGSDGYDIGVDPDGVPAYRAFFAKPVIAEVPAGGSLNDYLQHDGHISDEAITSSDAAHSRARSSLAGTAEPPRKFSPGEAASERAHSLRVGDVVPLDVPMHRIDGEYAVTSRTVDYEQNQINAELEFTTF